MNNHSFDARAVPPSPREMYSASHYETIPASNGVREETFTLKRAPPAVPIRSPDTRLSTFSTGRSPVTYDTGIYNEPDVFEEPSSPQRQSGRQHFTPSGSPKLPRRQEHHRPSLPGTSRPFCYGPSSSSELQRQHSGSDCSNGPRTPPHSQNYSPQWGQQDPYGVYTQMTDSITELPPYPYEEEPTYQTIQKGAAHSRGPAAGQRVASPVASRKQVLQGESSPTYPGYPGSPVYPTTPPHVPQQHRAGMGMDPTAGSPKHWQQWEGSGHPGYHPPSSPHAASSLQSHGYPSPTHSNSGYTSHAHSTHAYPSPTHSSSAYPSEGQQSVVYPSSALSSVAFPSNAHQGHAYPNSAHPSSTYPSNAHQSHTYPNSAHGNSGYPVSGHPNQSHPSPTHASNAYPTSTHPSYVYPSGMHSGSAGQQEHYMSMSPRAQAKFPKAGPSSDPGYNLGYNTGYSHGVPPPPTYPAPPPPLPGPGDRSPSPPLPPPPPELGRSGPPAPPSVAMAPQSGVTAPPPLPPISTIPNLKVKKQQEMDAAVKNLNQSLGTSVSKSQSQPMGDILTSDMAAELIKMRLKRAHQPEGTKPSLPKTSSTSECSELSTIQLRATGKLKEVCQQAEDSQEASRVPPREDPQDFPPPPPPPCELAVTPSLPPTQPTGSDRSSQGQNSKKSKEKQGPVPTGSMDIVIPDYVDINKCPGLVEIPYNCPNWKREMLEKKNKEKIEEYVQICMREKEEAEKWKHVPAWKRDILKKKSTESPIAPAEKKFEEPVKRSPPEVPPKESFKPNPNIVPAALSMDPEELESMPPWKRELLFKREKVPITFSNEFNPDEDENGQMQQS